MGCGVPLMLLSLPPLTSPAACMSVQHPCALLASGEAPAVPLIRALRFPPHPRLPPRLRGGELLPSQRPPHPRATRNPGPGPSPSVLSAARPDAPARPRPSSAHPIPSFAVTPGRPPRICSRLGFPPRFITKSVRGRPGAGTVPTCPSAESEAGAARCRCRCPCRCR